MKDTNYVWVLAVDDPPQIYVCPYRWVGSRTQIKLPDSAKGRLFAERCLCIQANTEAIRVRDVLDANAAFIVDQCRGRGAISPLDSLKVTLGNGVIREDGDLIVIT